MLNAIFRWSVSVLAVAVIFMAGVYANKTWNCSCGSGGNLPPIEIPSGPVPVTMQTTCENCKGKGCEKCNQTGWIETTKWIDLNPPKEETKEPPLADPVKP